MQGIRESAGWGPASWWPRAISSSSRTQTDPHPSQGTGGAASLSVGGCQTEKGIVEWVTREPLLSTECRAIPSRIAGTSCHIDLDLSTHSRGSHNDHPVRSMLPALVWSGLGALIQPTNLRVSA